MATCPECDAEVEVDEYDVEKGDVISCLECGASLEVIGTSPVEFELVPDDDEDEDEEEAEEDEEDEDEDDDEEEGDWEE